SAEAGRLAPRPEHRSGGRAPPRDAGTAANSDRRSRHAMPASRVRPSLHPTDSATPPTDLDGMLAGWGAASHERRSGSGENPARSGHMLPTMTGPAVGEPARVVAAPRRWSWASRFRVRQYVKSSLWFVPLLGGLLGLALAFADLAIDPHVQLPADFTYSSGTASSVLSTIVGAMVGLLGFVVTIGVLVVQTATGTLSPRFMRLWYRDPLQKVVLATFSGTFTFAFTLLRKVDDAHVPSIGVTIAGVLVTVSLFMLLVFLDRFTH